MLLDTLLLLYSTQCLIHLKFDSTGDIGAIGADGASHDGCYGAGPAAVQTLHGKCSNIL